jgi:hypothetical protein
LKCCSGRVRLEILRRIVGVQEVLVDNAFSSCEFTTVRFNSKYLLTETLTFCSGQLIVSTADSHSDDYFYCRCGVRVLTRLRNCAVRKDSLALSGRVEDHRHGDSLPSTRHTVAGQMERSRCRLDSLVQSSGPLHIAGRGGTRSDLQSSPCSSTLPPSLPFTKAKPNSTVTIGTNSVTATSTRLERRSSEHGKSNIK